MLALGEKMLRLITIFVTFASLAAVGVAGQSLWRALNTPPAELPQVVHNTATMASAPPKAAPKTPPLIWPDLFGAIQPPAPEPEPRPPAPQPQPPAPKPEPQPPAPPLDSLGYQLKGVVRTNNKVWAMVSHPTGERLMRVGDVLQDNLVVARIDDAGLWVSANGGPAQLLEFAQ